MNRMRRVLAVPAMVMLAAGCGGSSGGLDDVEPQSADEVTVVVKNQNFYDATVYATAQSASPRRVGSVPGNSERTFTFLWSWIEVAFTIRLTAVGEIRSGAIPVEPGEVLELTIPPDANMGSVRRRP